MKKLPTLHILNGDATLETFQKAALPGHVLVWREILSEGPAIVSLPEHEFWERRQKYITATYQETPESYNEKVLDELNKLTNAHAFFEVILWFDADLMCQINLLYLLQKLSIVKPGIISICTPKAGKNIAHLEPKEFQTIFEARQVQTLALLQQAKKLWQLYAGPDPLKLQVYLQEQQSLPAELDKALTLHLQRFPDCDTGLSAPKTALLQLVHEGATTAQELMQQFWKRHPSYGFGDWQILHLLKELQPDLLQIGEPLRLTALGKEVLNGKELFRDKTQWLGGAQLKPKQSWCYSTSQNQLVETNNLAPNVQ